MIKKVLAFFMSLSLMLAAAGCSNDNSKKSDFGKGRYVEEEISFELKPYGAGELFIQNNNISFIDKDEMKIYREDKEKKSFTAESLPSISELGENILINSIAGSNDGAYIFSYYDADDDSENYLPYYAYISPDGTLTKLNIENKSGFETFEISDDGKIFAFSFDTKVYEIDVENQSAKLLFSCDKELIAFDAVSGYVIAATASDVFLYDIKNDKLSDTSDALKTFIKEQKINSDGANANEPTYDFCSGSDNTIYIVSKNGLYRYVIGGNQIEQLFDGMSYHLGNPSYNVNSVMMESKNSFIVTYRDGNVMRYTYDASALNEVNSILKVYSLLKSDTLEQIISEYKIQNPNVKVDYEIGIESGGSTTYEDAIKNLNTEILSDNAPDIIMLDGMDTNNYIEKNILTDLSEYEKTIDPEDCLLDNIAKNQTDEGLYTMTCKFEVPIIIAEKDNLNKIKSFSDLADSVEKLQKTNSDYPVAGLYTEKEVLNMAIDLIGNKILTNDGIDAEQLKTFFENCTKIYKSQRAVLTEQDIADHNSVAAHNLSSSADKWGSEASGLSMYLLNNKMEIISGTTNGFLNSINIISSLNTGHMLESGEKVPSEIAYDYGLEENNTAFIPVCNLGICASGKNKKDAAEFLKTAFSEDVQNVSLNDGFPVNLNSLQFYYEKNKNPDDMNGFGTSTPDGEMILLSSYWMDETEVADFKQAIEQLDTPIQIDEMTRDTIINTGTKCLDGTITADEAVEEINSKLSLRMQE